jgi:acylphosphatase
MTTRHFQAKGKVQNVMFRQTLMRAAQRRGLEAGATNHTHERNQVLFSLRGADDKINEIIDFMRSGKPLNSWGARVDEVKEIQTNKRLEDHEVTTHNVDAFQWREGVEMYL